MKKTKEINWGLKLLTIASSFAMVLMLVLLVEPFSFVSNAQSQGKIKAASAKIRKEASTSSETLGSAVQGDSVTINHQITGSDNMVWYQVFVDANTLGYIRSDLVEITDGTTPPTGSAAAPAEPETNSTPVNSNENMAEVTAVEPMSASVKGSQSVRVRSNASTGSQIVTMAQNGLALTVIGQANGTDGKVWYQVNFLSDGAEVIGFIRSDYVELSGELVPVTNEPETLPSEEIPQEPETPAEPVIETKDWDTQRIDGKWYLINNVDPATYDIDNIFSTVESNQKVLEQAQSKTKSQRIWIVVLVFLVVGLAAAVAYLFYKMKDMADSAYFAQVEKETLRRRTADRPANANKKVMHTVGTDKKPAGARPAGAPAQNGQRPAGARPAGAPAQNGQRPAGARPAGAPVQNGQRSVGARPAGARPAGAPVQNGQQPAAKPVQKPAPKPQPVSNEQNPGWKSKNFMADEDEFEFEFLNWDGDDE